MKNPFASKNVITKPWFYLIPACIYVGFLGPFLMSANSDFFVIIGVAISLSLLAWGVRIATYSYKTFFTNPENDQ